MKTLYLHIGTPKTGTSALQHFCASNRKVLEQKGIYYPDLGFRFPDIGKNRNAHFLSYKEYINKKEKRRDQDAEQKIRTEGIQKLEEAFQTHDTVLLSDEHIWNEKEMTAETLPALKNHFAELGISIKIIVYLRRQDQVIQSFWAQKIKESSAITFESYMKKEKYLFFRLDYAARIQEFVDIVGRENMIVRCYEKQQYLGGQKTIMSDFLHIFGLNITDEFVNSEKVYNVSLEGTYLEVKRLFNTLPKFKSQKNYMIDLLKEQQALDYQNLGLERKKMYFTPEAEKEFMQRYEEENSTVAKEYFQREDGRLFFENYLDEIQGDNVGNSYTSKELVQICGNMMIRLYEKYEEVLQENKELKKRQKASFMHRVKRKLTVNKQS
ncbi:MAG: hypothetical protein K2J67_05270 [Lachnospiraceae bacterium]|nr:hypothetical protein [Lachnospiraceae bacterium]